MPSAQCQDRSDGCPKHVANGCCRSVSVCCKEKTDFQKTIQSCNDKIAQYKLDKRRLSDQFRKRPASKCDCSYKALSKTQYEAKCKEIQDKIDHCVCRINCLKNSKKAKQTVRDPHQCKCNCSCC